MVTLKGDTKRCDYLVDKNVRNLTLMGILKNKKMITSILSLVLILMPTIIFANPAVDGIPPDTTIVMSDIILVAVTFVFAGGLLAYLSKRNN